MANCMECMLPIGLLGFITCSQTAHSDLPRQLWPDESTYCWCMSAPSCHFPHNFPGFRHFPTLFWPLVASPEHVQHSPGTMPLSQEISARASQKAVLMMFFVILVMSPGCQSWLQKFDEKKHRKWLFTCWMSNPRQTKKKSAFRSHRLMPAPRTALVVALLAPGSTPHCRVHDTLSSNLHLSESFQRMDWIDYVHFARHSYLLLWNLSFCCTVYRYTRHLSWPLHHWKSGKHPWSAQGQQKTGCLYSFDLAGGSVFNFPTKLQS